MTSRTACRGRIRPGYGPGARALLSAAALLVLAPAATGCATTHPPGTPQDLGRFPIPTAPASPAPPTASPGRAQLVAMGDSVRADIGHAQVLVTASGPALDMPDHPGASPPSSARGTITVTVCPLSGATTLHASDLAVTDELGHPVRATPDRDTAQAPPGGRAVLHLAAIFAAGHAVITWKPGGVTMATWDFEVEVD